MYSPQTAASAIPSKTLRHRIKLAAADLAFVERDLLILTVLLQAAAAAVYAAHVTSRASVRNAQNHLDALSYYLSQVSKSELPALRENGAKSCTFDTVFPAVHLIEHKTKELRETLVMKRGN
jgi:hypothetical protein